MQQERSQMLGQMPMNRLVPKVSVPIMVSMLVQALYNIVDGIFVAKYSPDAFTAVSLVFPIQMLMVALSVGLGVGINSLISRRLGEKNQTGARDAAMNGIFMELLGCLAFCLFGLIFAKPFMQVFTNQPALQELGGAYLRIVTVFSLGLFMSVVFERMMQATGNSVLSMVTQLTGAITNIILDPIMIFTLDMGIAGAAWATVIGQTLGCALGLFLNQTRNRELRLKLRGFRPSLATIRNILTVGFPSVIMQAISSVMNVLMNLILMPYGNLAINVLGVYFKLQSFVFMPTFGLSNGLVAIIGYNYGAHNKERVYAAIKVALRLALCIMGVGMLVFLTVPQVLISLFETDGASDLTVMGSVALRVISLSFPLAAAGITLSTTFQAVGKGMNSLIMSLSRQMLVLIPVAFLLSKIFGSVNAIWWCFPIAEVVSLAVCLVMYRKVDREMLQTL